MSVLAGIIRVLFLAAVDVIRWAAGHPLADVPLGLLGWVLYAHFKPYRECRWCRRGGPVGGSCLARLAGHKPKRRHRGRCWRCKGTKLTRRLGAYHAHKVKQSLGQALAERGFRR